LTSPRQKQARHGCYDCFLGEAVYHVALKLPPAPHGHGWLCIFIVQSRDSWQIVHK
jgi:hypothetical protein